MNAPDPTVMRAIWSNAIREHLQLAHELAKLKPSEPDDDSFRWRRLGVARLHLDLVTGGSYADVEITLNVFDRMLTFFANSARARLELEVWNGVGLRLWPMSSKLKIGLGDYRSARP